MNRRSFLGIVGAAIAGAKARIWKPEPALALSLHEFNERYVGFAARALAGELDAHLVRGARFTWDGIAISVPAELK